MVWKPRLMWQLLGSFGSFLNRSNYFLILLDWMWSKNLLFLGWFFLFLLNIMKTLSPFLMFWMVSVKFSAGWV